MDSYLHFIFNKSSNLHHLFEVVQFVTFCELAHRANEAGKQLFRGDFILPRASINFEPKVLHFLKPV